MVVEDYKKINWLDFKKKFTVVKVFTDEECDKIINSIEENIDKLKITNENGWLYLSAYEMQITELSPEVQTIIKKVIGDFNLVLNQSFVIKYNQNLISNMPGHYDGTYVSLPINLNNDFEGGGTYLPFLKHTHIPQNYPKGCGLAFKANTVKSWHEALPVTKGDRYVLILKFNKTNNIFINLWNILKIIVTTKIVETFSKRYKKTPHN
jgi:hypothetical protein